MAFLSTKAVDSGLLRPRAVALPQPQVGATTQGPRLQGGLSGAGFTTDSGGSLIDGRRVLDSYSDKALKGGGHYSAFLQSGESANRQLAENTLRAMGREDLLTDGWWTEGVNDADNALRGTTWQTMSPEAEAALKGIQVARLGFGKDLRQFASIDPKTGKTLAGSDPYAYTSWKDAPLEAISVLGGAALMGMPGLGTALGGTLGATGKAAGILGNGLIQGGMSAVQGGNFLTGALAGGLSAPVGGAVSSALGGGALGQLGGKLAASTLSGALKGGSFSDALTNSVKSLASPSSLISLFGNSDVKSSLIPGFFDQGGAGAAPGGNNMDFSFDDFGTGGDGDFNLSGNEGGLSDYANMDDFSFDIDNPSGSSNWYGDFDFGGGEAGGSPLNSITGLLGKGADFAKGLLGGDKTATSQMNSILGLLGAYNAYSNNKKRGSGGGGLSPMAAAAMLPKNTGAWDAAQKAAAEKYFTSPLTQSQAATGQDAIRRFGVDPMNPQYADYDQRIFDQDRMMMRDPQRRRGYAEGGEVDTAFTMGEDTASGLLTGEGGGQDDVIDIRAAPGEYVLDADVVAALGDGSNEEGARRLDEMREAIRAHKRSADSSSIPPKAKSPLAYMKG
jgi:hypothetical protein